MQNVFTTSGSTVVTVPVGTVFGQVKQTSGGVVTGIGPASSFGTQNLMVSDSTGGGLAGYVRWIWCGYVYW